MPEKTISTFSMDVVEARGGYSLLIRGPDIGRVRATIKWPPNDPPDLKTRLESLHLDETLSREFLQTAGIALFNALFPEKIQTLYNQLKGRVGSFRIRLAVDPPELGWLPWELMYDNMAEPNGWLAQLPNHPFVRVASQTGIAAPLAVEPPIRVLFVGANPEDSKLLSIEQDAQNLRKALQDEERFVYLEPLLHATPDLLRERLRADNPQVLHYCGHGEFDEKTQRGYLVLENGQGGRKDLDSVELAKLLNDRDVRLVVLSACQTAKTGTREPLAGVAQRLIHDSSLPAVIAMQFPIYDYSSLAFSKAFYGALADDPRVDLAMTEGRQAIFEEAKAITKGPALADWLSPVLFMAAESGELLSPEAADWRAVREPDLWNDPEKVRGKPELLLGREEKIKEIQALLDMPEQILLYGFGGVGKTALVATLAARRIAKGQSTLWVEVGEEPAEPLLEGMLRELPPPPDEQSHDDLIARVRGRLLYSKPLLVLDDIWNTQTLATLDKALPRTIPVLMTSRHWIPFREGKLMELEDLDSPSAIKLVAYYADKGKKKHGDFIPDPAFIADPAVARLCEILGNNAYALEIAGSKLQPDNQTPMELCDEIVDAPHEIEMPEDFAEHGRESIKALLDVSWDSLIKAEGNAKDKTRKADLQTARSVFEAFGAFAAPGATEGLLAEYLGKDVKEIRRGLDVLVRRSLIKRYKEQPHGRLAREGTGFYQLHALTFSYVRALYEHTHREDRDRRSIIAPMQRFVKAHARKLDTLKIELPNIVQTASIALRVQNYTPAIDIVWTLAIDGYLDARGPKGLVEVLDAVLQYLRTQHALGDEVTAESPKRLDYLLGKRGNIFFDAGNYTAAAQTFEEALKVTAEEARKIKYTAVIGRTIAIGGDWDAGKQYIDRAYELARDWPDRSLETFILGNETHALGSLKQYDSVIDICSKLVGRNKPLLEQPNRQPDVVHSQFIALINWGSALRDSDPGLAEAALEHHMASLSLAEELDSDNLRATAWTAVLEDAVLLRDRTLIDEYYEKTLCLWTSLGNEKEAQKLRQLKQSLNQD